MTDTVAPTGGARSIKKVGLLFSGGPAPAANAVISAAVMNFVNAGIEICGFLDGYYHLANHVAGTQLREGVHYRCLGIDDVSGIRHDGDIIIRTSRANPGKDIACEDDLRDPDKTAKLRNVFRAFDDLDIDALVSIGGDDTLKTANYIYKLQEVDPGLRRVAVVHLPKTIDNDYYGIDFTFGFTSAADFAAHEIRNLIADAKSTCSWWILEIMGRKAGWLTYAAGIAGTATKMISVEDVDGEFDLEAAADEIVELILSRRKDGRCYGAVCVAEGLADLLPEHLRPREYDMHGNPVLGKVEVGKKLADEVSKRYKARTGEEVKVRAKQIGYETRCVPPSAFDVLLGSALGVGAYRALVEDGQTGVMVSVEKQMDLKYVPFSELIDPETLKTRIRYIERDSDFYRLARALEYQRKLALNE
ncbi:MAG: 6-phosphofructokinase [Coriobacteriia bacterium]